MTTRKIRIATGLLTAALGGLIVSAQAQGILMPEYPVLDGGRGQELPHSSQIRRPPFVQPFYVKNLRVSTVINDAVAETTVEQTFVNSASSQLEATYLYPLPAGANPTGFSMTSGDKTMEPRILTKEEASRVYEGYVRRYRDPALLEYVGRGLVKVSVFPVPAQGERTIRMRYTEVIRTENGMHKYVYPLSTSRFGARPVGVATVNIKLQTSSPIKNVYSPTHDLSVRHEEESRATASWEAVNDTSDRDLALYFSTSNDDIGLSMLTYKSGDRDGYFMLLASPRVAVPRERILPKEIVFVLDRTGSMSGPKIEQARKSLLYCLNSLHPSDRFDLITFNESPDTLYKTLVPATADNVAKARRFVDNIEAAGGTNIDEALRSATKLLRDEAGAGKMIVFLTDGLPTVGETDTETILKHVREWNHPVVYQPSPHPTVRTAAYEPTSELSARIFCFGLGYDVNVPFLDKLSEVGRGDSDYIKPEEDVEARVSSFFAKVASPVLSRIEITFDGLETHDVFPKALPDMFKGSQLVVTGRFRGSGAGTVTLTGTTNGAGEHFKVGVHAAEAEGSNTFVPRIWAQRKLGFLIDQVRLSNNPGAKTELLDEIVRISKEYGIITEYTSFLVDEPEQRRLGMRPGLGGDNLAAMLNDNPNIRQEVAKRAIQNGISGEGVTDQSGRARDLRGSDKASSRYQSAHGSVALGGQAPTGAIGAYGRLPSTLSAPGNFKYQPSGGGLGGRIYGDASSRSSSDKALERSDAGNAISMQNVGGHTFYKVANNVWKDDSYTVGKQTVVRIQAFSDAHFELLRQIPLLGLYSSVGEHIIVRLNDCALEIGDEGKASLSAADLKTILRK